MPWSIPREVIGWAHYRGGLTSPLRLLSGGEDQDIGIGDRAAAPEDGVNHLEPVWLAGTLYFRADPNGVFDVYAARPDLEGGSLARLTRSTGLGVSDLAADVSTGRLVFVRDGRLFTLDPASGEERKVPVTLRIDRIVRNVHFSHLSPLLNPPLDGPGVDVREGDFVIAIDGEEVTAERNLYSFLAGKANEPIGASRTRRA